MQETFRRPTSTMVPPSSRCSRTATFQRRRLREDHRQGGPLLDAYSLVHGQPIALVPTVRTEWSSAPTVVSRSSWLLTSAKDALLVHENPWTIRAWPLPSRVCPWPYEPTPLACSGRSSAPNTVQSSSRQIVRSPREEGPGDLAALLRSGTSWRSTSPNQRSGAGPRLRRASPSVLEFSKTIPVLGFGLKVCRLGWHLVGPRPTRRS